MSERLILAVVGDPEIRSFIQYDSSQQSIRCFTICLLSLPISAWAKATRVHHETLVVFDRSLYHRVLASVVQSPANRAHLRIQPVCRELVTTTTALEAFDRRGSRMVAVKGWLNRSLFHFTSSYCDWMASRRQLCHPSPSWQRKNLGRQRKVLCPDRALDWPIQRARIATGLRADCYAYARHVPLPKRF